MKSLDLDQHDDEIKDIQKEIALLSQLKAGDAPNITAFHGSYLLGHRLWVIMDFCSGGSVRTLVRLLFFLSFFLVEGRNSDGWGIVDESRPYRREIHYYHSPGDFDSFRIPSQAGYHTS